MYRYAKTGDYTLGNYTNTKVYQHAFLRDWLPRYAGAGKRVLEVGANENVSVLGALEAAEKWIADPYEAMAGARLTEVPDLGAEYRISRCLIGVDSHALPSDPFDLIFSSSVLEHIGQEAAGYDCGFTRTPPEAQEAPRRAFCAECFRLLRPGGVTIHTIDHGVRNLTYDANFLGVGFRPLLDEPRFTLEQMWSDPEALRQPTLWRDPRKPMPEEQRRLHTVLLLGYRKPEEAARRFARRPPASAEAERARAEAAALRREAAALRAEVAALRARAG